MVTGPLLLPLVEGPPQACNTIAVAKNRIKRDRGKKLKLLSLCITHLLVD